MNDTDIEQANLNATANREIFLKKRGICCHGSLQGAHPTFAPELKGNQIKCRDCGAIFPNLEWYMEEREERLA